MKRQDYLFGQNWVEQLRSAYSRTYLLSAEMASHTMPGIVTMLGGAYHITGDIVWERRRDNYVFYHTYSLQR